MVHWITVTLNKALTLVNWDLRPFFKKKSTVWIKYVYHKNCYLRIILRLCVCWFIKNTCILKNQFYSRITVQSSDIFHLNTYIYFTMNITFLLGNFRSIRGILNCVVEVIAIQKSSYLKTDWIAQKRNNYTQVLKFCTGYVIICQITWHRIYFLLFLSFLQFSLMKI